MNISAERLAASSPTSSTDRLRQMNESKRKRDSFSFDPMGISPIFKNLEFYVDIDHSDPQFAVEVKKMIEKMEGKIAKKIRPDLGLMVIWRRGSYSTMVKADEAKVPIVNQRWVFACAQNNEKLGINPYLISRSEREEAKLRMELGIKKECKNKRVSAPSKQKVNQKKEAPKREDRTTSRVSMQLERASKKGDIDGILATMAGTLKEICEDDPELNNILGSEINDRFNIQTPRPSSESTKTDKSQGKKTKMFDNELSLKKPAVVIEAREFVRCLQNCGFRTLLYQGNFSEVKEFRSYFTEDNFPLTILKAESYYHYANDINYFLVLPDSQPSMGLLYSILKGCRIVDSSFLSASRQAGVLVSLSKRQDLLCNAKYTPRDTTVLRKTTIMVYSPPHISKQVGTRLWTVKAGIEKYGGVVTETASLADLLIVMLEDTQEFLNRKEKSKLKGYALYIVTERWLLDSIFTGIRKQFDAKEYQVQKEEQPPTKKGPSLTSNLRQYLRMPLE